MPPREPHRGRNALSGTSAGALNAAIVASALARGSTTLAREKLREFWTAVARPAVADIGREIWGPAERRWRETIGAWLVSANGVLPYQANPLGINPLRDLIAAHVDIDAIRSKTAPALYVTITNVKTGLPRVISNHEMTGAVLLASACLPPPQRRRCSSLHEGKAEALMKGSLHTDELMGAVVKRDTGLRTARRLSHCVNPKVPSTIEAAALCKMADRGQVTGAILDGPLALDNAISLESVKIKKINSPVASRANVLMVPDLEAGNMLAKSLSFLANADAAGIVLGARVPIILTSRRSVTQRRNSSSSARN